MKITNIETLSEVHGITEEHKKRLSVEKNSISVTPTEVMVETYKCPYCADGEEKVFSTKTSLKIHIGKMHKDSL